MQSIEEENIINVHTEICKLSSSYTVVTLKLSQNITKSSKKIYLQFYHNVILLAIASRLGCKLKLSIMGHGYTNNRATWRWLFSGGRPTREETVESQDTTRGQSDPGPERHGWVRTWWWCLSMHGYDTPGI